MYLNSSSSACDPEAVAADWPRTCYAAVSVEAVTRERPLDDTVWKPRAERMASDSFVDTILFRLSAVSILSEDCKTVTRLLGNTLCSYPGFGPIHKYSSNVNKTANLVGPGLLTSKISLINE